MAPTSSQSTSRRKIPALYQSKMSKAEKREFFRDQRILARARKSKKEASEQAESSADSSIFVDTTTFLEREAPTSTL